MVQTRGRRWWRRLMYFSLFLITAIVVGLAVLVRWIEPRLAFFPARGELETPLDFDFPYTDISIATADGEQLHAWQIPAASPRARIVYFHGNGGNLSNWSPIVTGIARQGYSIFAFDYRGYGRSSGRPTEEGLYRDVDAVVRRAWPEKDGVPLIYWGRSLGTAMAGYAATVRQPDGLILESGFPDARSAIRTSTLLYILSFLASYRFPAADFVNRAGRPVLVMHGDRDGVIPFDLGRELFDRIQVEKSFVAIEGGDHNDSAPPHPQLYWTAVERLISTAAQPKPTR
jgi:uncharacterized protein